jgi:hypothetical protein
LAGVRIHRIIHRMPSPTTATRPQVLTLAAAHALRAGPGLDAVRVRARGHGLLFGPGGVRLVWGAFEGVVLRRFPGSRARAVFVGLEGLARAAAPLPPQGRASRPAAPWLEPPPAPPPPRVPPLAVPFTPLPPEVP